MRRQERAKRTELRAKTASSCGFILRLFSVLSIGLLFLRLFSVPSVDSLYSLDLLCYTLMYSPCTLSVLYVLAALSALSVRSAVHAYRVAVLEGAVAGAVVDAPEADLVVVAACGKHAGCDLGDSAPAAIIHGVRGVGEEKNKKRKIRKTARTEGKGERIKRKQNRMETNESLCPFLSLCSDCLFSC